MKPGNDRARELAAIHVMAAQLGLDTHDPDHGSAYRQMLLARGGAASAASLTQPGRKRVLAHLRALVDPTGQPARPRPPGGWQADKIRTLWQQLGDAGVLRDPSERSLREFVHSLTSVEAPAFLNSQQANRVIEALKAWLKRRGLAA